MDGLEHDDPARRSITRGGGARAVHVSTAMARTYASRCPFSGDCACPGFLLPVNEGKVQNHVYPFTRSVFQLADGPAMADMQARTK